MLLKLLKVLFITQSGSYSCCFETFPQGKETVPHKKKFKRNKVVCKNQILFFYSKVSHNSTYVNIIAYVTMLKVTSTIVLVGLRTFTMGGGMHSLFEFICRSGTNPEKVFRIR